MPAADRRFAWINGLLLLAVALAGIAHLAFLPPFEGFDETDHFAYIQQLADSGTIPRFGIDRMSSDVESYPGPRHYATRAPFDSVGGLSYRSFFNGSTLPDLTPPNALAYRPGRAVNREASAALLPGDGAVLSDG